MKYCCKLFCIFFTCLLAVTIVTNSQADEIFYNKIVIFGDSLSDNGNLYQLLLPTGLPVIPKSPPYFQGRFSNGYVWADYVDQYSTSKKQIAAYNFAIGGETVIPSDYPFTLMQSIGAYQLHQQASSDIAHTLFIMLIGANDYKDGAENTEAITSTVVQGIKAAIDFLITQGGKNFLIFNLPDMSRTPYAQKSTIARQLNELSTVHNIKLQAMIWEIQATQSSVNIHLFDFNKAVSDLITIPGEFNKKFNTHLTNTTDACWKGGVSLALTMPPVTLARELTSQATITLTKNVRVNANTLLRAIHASPALVVAYNVGQEYLGGESPCSHPEEYVFWDDMHPSATSHLILSQLVIDYMNQHYHSKV